MGKFTAKALAMDDIILYAPYVRRETSKVVWGTPPKDCPIVGEIPDKHGDLKDAGFIISCLEEIKDTYPRTYEIIKGILDRTPTVLEACKEES